MRHLLSIEDLDRAAIERICDRAAAFAEVAELDDADEVTITQRQEALPA